MINASYEKQSVGGGKLISLLRICIVLDTRVKFSQINGSEDQIFSRNFKARF